jgi:hypothetical protein
MKSLFLFPMASPHTAKSLSGSDAPWITSPPCPTGSAKTSSPMDGIGQKQARASFHKKATVCNEGESGSRLPDVNPQGAQLFGLPWNVSQPAATIGGTAVRSHTQHKARPAPRKPQVARTYSFLFLLCAPWKQRRYPRGRLLMERQDELSFSAVKKTACSMRTGALTGRPAKGNPNSWKRSAAGLSSAPFS